LKGDTAASIGGDKKDKKKEARVREGGGTGGRKKKGVAKPGNFAEKIAGEKNSTRGNQAKEEKKKTGV